MVRSRWFGLGVALLAAAASAWAFARLPAAVPVAWRADTAAEASRLRVAVLLPALIAALWMILQILPRIDPRRASYESFSDTYWLIGNGVMFFLGGVHAVTLATALGMDLDARRFLFVGAGVLISMVGNYLSRVEPNWFIGIRTPWTLSSEVVWRKTHRVMGWIFFIAGLLIATLAFSPGVDVTAVLGATMAGIALISIVVSYVLWRRLGEKQRTDPTRRSS